MTEEQLREIKARTNAATPGPWRAHQGVVYSDATIANFCYGGTSRQTVTRAEMECNTEFVAEARTDVALLLAEIERLRIENSRAFLRGAAVMRSEAANLFEGTADKPGLAAMPAWAAFIRDLPLPKDSQ